MIVILRGEYHFAQFMVFAETTWPFDMFEGIKYFPVNAKANTWCCQGPVGKALAASSGGCINILRRRTRYYNNMKWCKR